MRIARFFRSFKPFACLVAVGMATLLLSGCLFEGHMSTFDTKGPVARVQYELWMITIWVTLFIFIAVGGVLAYATWRFRVRSSADEHAEPPAQSHGNPVIEIGLIVVSVLLLVVIAVPTLHAIWYTYDVPEEEGEPYVVEAIGYQWWFHFRYPDDGAITSNELVIPTDRAVRIHLRTNDVIHSFWVPKLAGKVDMIPNRANYLWLKADHPGYYWGQCAEFCGESHANMRFRVIALEQPDFEVWLAHQKEDARTVTAQNAGRPDGLRTHLIGAEIPPGALEAAPAFEAWRQQQLPDPAENPALIDEGRSLLVSKGCVVCHNVSGHIQGGIRGPDLTHFGSRTTVAAGLLDNTPENLHRWLRDPEGVKPGNLMYRDGYLLGDVSISDEEADALVAYLLSLK